MINRQVIGPPEEFYNVSMQYLAYTSLDTLKPATKYALATDIALAAATGMRLLSILKSMYVCCVVLYYTTHLC